MGPGEAITEARRIGCLRTREQRADALQLVPEEARQLVRQLVVAELGLLRYWSRRLAAGHSPYDLPDAVRARLEELQS